MSDLLAAFVESGFMPHGHCYLWRPEILWLHVGSDALIAASYFSIPAALVTLVRRREDLVFNWIFLLFGAFIFWCGVTHVFGIVTTWVPVYELEGWVKLTTALVSAATAVLVWPLLPRALRLPSSAQLEEANQRYRSLNAELEERVRKRTEELEQRNADLQSFSSFLSHELRQPLHTIGLGLPVLAAAVPGGRPEQRETVARMRRAVDIMAEQIDAQLFLASVVTGEIQRRPVDLVELARSVGEEMRVEISAAQAELEIAGSIPSVLGDPRLLRQLLRNLLENAIKYRRPQVPLRVRLAGGPDPARRGFVRVRVEDNGRGFAPSDAERIFERFERADGSGVPGTGIGLTLCRRIAERHGGSIRATGQPGEGASFEIVLPVAPEPATS